MKTEIVWEDVGLIRHASDSFNCATVDIWCEEHGIWVEFHVGDQNDLFGDVNEEVTIRVLRKAQIAKGRG